MGTLKATLLDHLNTYRKTGDDLKRNTLSLVLSGIGTVEKQGKTAREFTDEEVLSFLTTEVKKRRETAQKYTEAGVVDRAVQETAEADFLATYLPTQLTEAELVNIVTSTVASNAGANMGAIMGKVMGQVKGKADGAVVRKIVQEVLAS